jgi:hypothetical protein
MSCSHLNHFKNFKIFFLSDFNLIWSCSQNVIYPFIWLLDGWRLPFKKLSISSGKNRAQIWACQIFQTPSLHISWKTLFQIWREWRLMPITTSSNTHTWSLAYERTQAFSAFLKISKLLLCSERTLDVWRKRQVKS